MSIERRRRRRDLIPRDPFDIIRRFRTEIEDFMGGFGPGFSEIMDFRTPPIDIQETENEIIVKADIPGFEKENIDLEITGDRLRIKAESETGKEEEEKEKGYHRRERSRKSVYREILLPKNTKPEESKASYKNGVLKVILTKTEDAKGKKLEIA